jgi:hypothetical protein
VLRVEIFKRVAEIHVHTENNWIVFVDPCVDRRLFRFPIAPGERVFTENESIAACFFTTDQPISNCGA